MHKHYSKGMGWILVFNMDYLHGFFYVYMHQHYSKGIIRNDMQ